MVFCSFFGIFHSICLFLHPNSDILSTYSLHVDTICNNFQIKWFCSLFWQWEFNYATISWLSLVLPLKSVTNIFHHNRHVLPISCTSAYFRIVIRPCPSSPFLYITPSSSPLRRSIFLHNNHQTCAHKYQIIKIDLIVDVGPCAAYCVPFCPVMGYLRYKVCGMLPQCWQLASLWAICKLRWTFADMNLTMKFQSMTVHVGVPIPLLLSRRWSLLPKTIPISATKMSLLLASLMQIINPPHQ